MNTRKQLQKKVNCLRTLIRLFRRSLDEPKHKDGVECFLDTEAGRIRALAYNMDTPETLPLYVNLHGGGFVLGRPEMDDPYLLHVAKTAHVKILSPDYSLAPEAPFPAALNEIFAVVKHVKLHAGEFGIDAQRIALGGHSAGGNFSAAVALMDGEKRELGLAGLVLDYPPMDVYTDAGEKPLPKGSIPPKMSRLFDACYCENREERKNPLVSPCYATPDQVRLFPPTLVITAGRDSLCGEAEKFKDLLISAGVDVTFKRFEDSKHGFTLSNKPDAREGWQLIIDFLNRYLQEERGRDRE
ncbi:MAG: alpha/beta hydrolase [Tannerella sp.]|jgi:acetyl esterase|nr:alpha/beta hydrolase [Tannerella sp.]